MAQTDTVAVTKKLNFGTTPHRHVGTELVDPEEALVTALEHPTPESLHRCGPAAPAQRQGPKSARTSPMHPVRLQIFHPTLSATCCHRAVTAVQAACSKRFEDVEAAALAMSEDVGEAGLRRLKRQFGSVKNSFLHFEVKESFITCALARMGGGSSGTGVAQLGAPTLGWSRALRPGPSHHSAVTTWPCPSTGYASTVPVCQTRRMLAWQRSMFWRGLRAQGQHAGVQAQPASLPHAHQALQNATQR